MQYSLQFIFSRYSGWGIRGAGFNFGYVLNATYRIYDQIPNGLHLNADFKFPISQVHSYYERLNEMANSHPKEFSILTLFNYDADLNETIITANAVYAGPEADGRAAVQFLLDQNPLVSNITTVPWISLLDTVGFGFTGPAIFPVFGLWRLCHGVICSLPAR